MDISKQDIVQLFRAADLDPEEGKILIFLESLDFSLDLFDNTALGFDLLEIFEDHNRAVWIDWKARFSEVSEKFNLVLSHYGEKLKISQMEIGELDQKFYTASEVVEDIILRLNEANISVIEFDTEEDSYACFIFNKEEFSQYPNNDLYKLINRNYHF